MKKVLKVIKNNSLNLIAIAAFVIGTASVSSATFLFSHQPKCPKELLK